MRNTAARHASPPQVPPATAPELRARAQREQQTLAAKRSESRRQARGLLLLAILVLAFSIWRAGAANVFPHGWWRLW
jgi:hypothetical protein